MIGSLLELHLDDGRKYRLVVESVRNDGLLVVTGPKGMAYPDLTSLDVPFTIGWLADRSWFVVPATRVRPAPGTATRWQVEISTKPRPVNRRRFVRGGGGETIKISGIGPDGATVPVLGKVVDLSEGGVRCKVPAFESGPGDVTNVVITLNGQRIEATGIVQDLREPLQRPGVEPVLVYGLPEDAAQLIRQYLFRLQLEKRRAKRADGEAA